jgi:hypothetical protein
MFWMGAYPLRGEVGGGWALEFKSFLGPVKWQRADRRVPFGAQKTRSPSHQIQYMYMTNTAPQYVVVVGLQVGLENSTQTFCA